MSVKRLASGRYKARVRLADGREVSRTFTLKRDADEWEQAQRTEIRRGRWVDPREGRQSFIAWADEWAAAQEWKQTTRDYWGHVRARLEPAIGELPLAGFDRMTLQRLRTELATRYAPSTVAVTMRYVTMVLRAAYVNRRIGHDPTVGLREPRRRADDPGRVGPDDVPTRAEALAILTGAPDRYRAAVALGFAGLRVGEVLGMHRTQLDLPVRRVTVDRQSARHDGRFVITTPKAEKIRTITVPPLVAVELRRHVRGLDGELLFPAAHGGLLHRARFYERGWRPALLAAGLPQDRFRFHACRHWCASTMLAEGAPLAAVAGHLGDTVATVSRTYVHWLRDDREVPADVLDRVLAPEIARLPRGQEG